MTFQVPVPIIEPSMVPSRNEPPATSLVLEQPMIRPGGFLPATTFQAFVPNIVPSVAPSRNTIEMLGFIVFSTLRAPAANSSISQIVNLDRDKSTARIIEVIEPIGTALGDATPYDFLLPSSEAVLPSLTPGLPLRVSISL